LTALTEAIQSFEPGDLIELFELDATSLGGQVYRFTSSVYGENSVVFDGLTYTPIDFKSSGWEVNGKGLQPTPVISISNVALVLSSAVIDFDDLIGAVITRIRTFRQFLDDGAEPNPTAVKIDIYRVERKSSHNKVFIEWELSSVLDQQGVRLPGRQILKDACTHRYRRYDSDTGAFDYTTATCPYAGSVYFTATDSPTASPALDVCGKRLTSCRARFGEHGNLPTRAFPGSARFT
jgi:lambda family phage minor tail protein L